MITLYSGTPGSGKSYHATLEVYYALHNKNVIANYELDTSCIKKKHKYNYIASQALTVDYLMAYAKVNHVPFKEHQTLLVIDEAGLKFNSRDWQAKDRMNWLDFFSQHRKFGFDVILIAQADLMLDKQIRAFIEVEENHRLMAQCGIYGKVLGYIFRFVDIKRWYGNKMRLGADYIIYRSKIAHMYNSMGFFDNGTS